MKKVGVLLVIAAMVIGYISDNYISSIWFESFIALAFCFWLIGIYALIFDNNCQKKGMPKYDNPSAPPKMKRKAVY